MKRLINLLLPLCGIFMALILRTPVVTGNRNDPQAELRGGREDVVPPSPTDSRPNGREPLRQAAAHQEGTIGVIGHDSGGLARQHVDRVFAEPLQRRKRGVRFVRPARQHDADIFTLRRVRHEFGQ